MVTKPAGTAKPGAGAATLAAGATKSAAPTTPKPREHAKQLRVTFAEGAARAVEPCPTCGELTHAWNTVAPVGDGVMLGFRRTACGESFMLVQVGEVRT